MQNWDNFRKDWQEHIQNVYKMVEKHSELAVRTGDPFHEKAYNNLTNYLHELKTWIKHNENLTNTANESKIKEGEKAIW